MPEAKTAVPFAPVAIDHVVFRVADPARVERFYVEVIGCSVERRQADIGLTQLRAGRSLIDLVSLDGTLGSMGGEGPGTTGRNVDHVCLRIEPYDDAAIRQHLAAHGIEIDSAGDRYGAEGFGPSIYVRDPEGNTVELKGPPTFSIGELKDG